MKFVPMKRISTFVALLVCNFLQAANSPPPPTTPPPPGLPIDAGVIVLVFISVAFAFYKLKTKFQKN